MVDNIKRNKQRLEAQLIVTQEKEVKETDLVEIKGIGQKTADILYSLGLKNQKQLKAVSEEKFKELEKAVGNSISFNAIKAWLEF